MELRFHAANVDERCTKKHEEHTSRETRGHNQTETEKERKREREGEKEKRRKGLKTSRNRVGQRDRRYGSKRRRRRRARGRDEVTRAGGGSFGTGCEFRNRWLVPPHHSLSLSLSLSLFLFPSLFARLHRERTAGMRMNRLRDDPLPR